MAAKEDGDPILANEQRLKNQKQIVQQLHKQLKGYNEAFRQFLSAETAFYDTLDNLCESSWELKADFSKSLQNLRSIAEKGARSLETIPVEDTIVFRDQFGPFEKEIQDYKEKQKIADAAEKKHAAYLKKRVPDSEELRKLELAAYERKTSLWISRRKLTDELPTFYKSRMDYYSTFWRSTFQIRANIARAELETFDELIEQIARFDRSRSLEASKSPSVASGICFKAAAKLQSASSELAATEVKDEPAATAADHHQQNGQQQRQPTATTDGAGVRRVPTFGGNDMSREDSGRSKPPVPRRGSLHSLSN